MAAEHHLASQAGELRELIRHWRRGRATKTWWDAATDAYIWIFSGLVIGAMSISAIMRTSEFTSAGCGSLSCEATRWWLPLAWGLGVLSLLAVLTRAFGPVHASPADASWLLAAPVDRRALLRPGYLRRGLLFALVGGLIASVVPGLAGQPVVGVLTFAVAVIGLAWLIAGLGALVQSRVGTASAWPGRLAAAGAWLILLGLASGALTPGPALDGPAGLVVAAALLLAGLASLLNSTRHFEGLSRRALTPGGRLAPSLSGALASLDPALLFDVVILRRWMGVDAVRVRRVPARGMTALVLRDALRLVRNPGPLVGVCASVVLPYVAWRSGAGVFVVPVGALGLFVAGLALMVSLRVWVRSAGLSRMFPLSDRQLRMSSIVVPGVLLVGAGLASAPAVHAAVGSTWGVALGFGVGIGLSALACAVRWVSGKPPNYDRPLISTPAGGVPANLYGSTLRGFDIWVLTMLPVIIWPTQLGAGLCVVLSGLTISVLLGNT